MFRPGLKTRLKAPRLSLPRLTWPRSFARTGPLIADLGAVLGRAGTKLRRLAATRWPRPRGGHEASLRERDAPAFKPFHTLKSAGFVIRTQTNSLRTDVSSKGMRLAQALKPRKRVGLALQGGGAHGAFTWGVLEGLIDLDTVKIEAISGASAGAMNAAVFASGWVTGGPEGAKDALANYWWEVSEAGRKGKASNPLPGWTGFSSTAFDLMTTYLSPYQFNPLDINPLRSIIAAHVDFEALAEPKAIQLFIAATDVETGSRRIFRNHELSADVLLASACLPQLFKAVEIDGRAYWDGGYTANPPVLPLAVEAGLKDILLILIEPAEREAVPRTAKEIKHRLTEVMFSAPLTAELEALELFQRQGARHRGAFDPRVNPLAALRVQRLEAHPAMASLPSDTKLNPDWAFLNQLRVYGQARAAEWGGKAPVALLPPPQPEEAESEEPQTPRRRFAGR